MQIVPRRTRERGVPKSDPILLEDTQNLVFMSVLISSRQSISYKSIVGEAASVDDALF